MADLTFAELQRKMQLEKRKTKDVKYAFRNAEDIYTAFKELNSDWSVIASDELIEVAGRVFIQSTAFALDKEGNIKQQSTSFAELSTVPVFNTQKGQVKQMQDPQWTGAVSSYARKYALQGLFAIGEKDIDEYPVEESQEQNQVRYIDNIQYQEIIKNVEEIAAIKGAPFDTVANFVLSKYQIDDFHKVPVDGYNIVMEYLTKQIQKAYEKQGV
ncbi:putative Erf protein [Streptococcus pneumoniae]|uniref:ERF family protein n=1 Tax=Streptococcus pneumoniae TaxID=1313 RepID=UPI0005DA76CA|nr:ERF family protein [Streptococcus pneumoniae]MDS2244877.1 ERF family protein [Streptococcus pneumoniae]MDS5919713.1 ERF family protein [Streptococcus pneumoniae]MDS8569226.1 ERF family protein [Streptococcus pneumoniae]MDS9339877.1 ERF family protein [Streptococcus pneumoniae]MDT5655717.1 ERF family protein [Streptococcus pneumoniae]